LRLIIDPRLLEVLESGLRVRLPQLLDLVDLLRADLARAELLLVGRDLSVR
jgi:hypothetical protein